MPANYDPDIHHRRSLRLRGYNYSQPGAYSVTIVTQCRECLFGEVIDGRMILNDAGDLVKQAWENLPNRFPSVDLDAFIVMPNHLHGIIVVIEGDTSRSAPNQKMPALGDIMRAFKSISAIDVNRILSRRDQPVWQRNYHDHIIRNERDLDNRRQYIVDNPGRWAEDEENPNRQITG